MKPSNTKLLFHLTNVKSDDNVYIFLISEDKYEYRLVSYNYRNFYYVTYTLNKIVQDLVYEKQDSL